MTHLLEKPKRRRENDHRRKNPVKHHPHGDITTHILEEQPSDGIEIPSRVHEDTGGHPGHIQLSNHQRSIPTNDARCYCPRHYQGVDVLATDIKIHQV